MIFKHIVIGADSAGYHLKEQIKEKLITDGYDVTDCGTDSDASCHYPVYGAAVAKAVRAAGADTCGILVCGTGVGIGITANKVPGIRCVTCSDPLSAELGRRHNNANMLSMGARIIGPELAKCIARAFLTAQFEGGRHALRVEMLSALERGEEIE